MPRFLIDVNLPYFFSLWDNPDYIHQKDINDEYTDEQIWKYAEEREPTIITKDSDFSNKIVLRQPPPKVIHIRFGNMKIRDFHDSIHKVWKDVLILNKTHKLISVYKDRIEALE